MGYFELEYPSGYIKKAEELGILADGMSKAGELKRSQAIDMLCAAYNLIPVGGDKTLRESYLAAVKGVSEEVAFFADGAAPAAFVSGSGGGSASVSKSADMAKAAKPETAGEAPAPVIYPDYGQNTPQAGQITAGEWNDNENWADFNLLMTDETLHGYVEKWGMNLSRYCVRATSGGEPAADAAVEVFTAGGEKIAGAVSDKDGMAYLFLTLDAASQQDSAFTLKVRSGEGETVTEGWLPDNEKPTEVVLEQKKQPEDVADVMFMIDTTGSMGDELQYIKEELKDVISRVNSTVRISCNYYRDEGDAYIVRPFAFTTDVDLVLSQLSGQYAAGGGDFPEAVDKALDNAVSEHEWSPDARARLLFLVLDAPPHYNDESIASIQSSIKAAAEKGIRLVPVVSSGADKETELLLRAAAVNTGGTYIFLTDDSGIGNSHIKADVGDYEVEYLNEMILRIINEYIG